MPHDAKINAAVLDCVNTLAVGCSRLDHLAAYADRLSADPAWSRTEIHEVDSAAHKILVKRKHHAE